MTHRTTFVLATLATLAAAPAALAATVERPAFEPSAAAALTGIPVHVAVVNERLQLQVPLLAWSEDPKARKRVLVRSEPAGYGHGATRVELMGGGLLDVAASELATPRRIRKAGVPLLPAAEALQAAQCDLPGTTLYADAVTAGVRATAWGATSPVRVHRVDAADVRMPVASPGGRLLPRPGWKGRWANASSTGRADLSQQPSYEFEVRYSLTPDFAAVVTTVMARAYSQTLPGARTNWQDKPAWEEELVVVSDALALAPKSAADMADAVARENAQYATLGIPALAKKAEAGDAAAREEAWLAQQAHKAMLRDAQSPDWVWQDAAMKRAPLWAENGCARMHAAMAANATEVTRLLGLLFAGKLDDALPEDWSEGKGGLWTVKPAVHAVATGAAAGERRLYQDGPRIVVSRRAGDDVMLDFRYTWLTGLEGPAIGEAGADDASDE
jgi:hypothetical protein